MKAQISWGRKNDRRQRGAALVTVMLISALLLTACIAMLTAAGANARNTTDVLAETKAYYAAESGIQATINILRNTKHDDGTPVTYKEAVADPDLSTWLPYNYPAGAPTRVVIGETAGGYNPNNGSAYSVIVEDPDRSALSTTFTTSGTVAPLPSSSPAQVTFSPISTAVQITNFSQAQALGTFQLTEAGAGAAISPTRFSITYAMSLPRPGSIALGGYLRPGSVSGTFYLQFDSATYKLLGSTIRIQGLSGGRTGEGTAPITVTALIEPVAPYRLRVKSTGYGPNGSKKTLEAVVRQNLFDGLASGAATSMIGAPCPVGEVCFAPGTSTGITYDGCAPPPCPGCPSPGCVPSFGVTNQATLDYILAHPPGGELDHMTPPPTLLDPSTTPSWQSDPATLDALVDQVRTSAQNSGRYFLSPTHNLNDPGSWESGTGVTFCEGSCTVAGDGGGLLVVTGKLTNLGGFRFKGMIIVTGEEGWLRNGGGNGQVVGNIVIAPYNRMSYVPENLSSTFLTPIYKITGGGSSDVIYGDITASFDNTSGISDFVAGVAEK